MKRVISVFAAAFAALVLFSCNQEKEQPSVKEVTVTVQMPEEFPAEAVFAGKVVLSNKTTSETLEAQAEAGAAVFKKVPFGVYDCSASWSLSGEEFAAMAPEIASVNGVLVNGVTPEVVLSETSKEGVEISVKTVSAMRSALVFSRIYNFGTLNLAGKAYNVDKYLEIFNNSDEVQYLDGLYIGEAYGSAVVASTLPNVAETNVVYMQRISRFPGEGTQYPVEPGKSVVIAQNAKNHIDTEVIVNTVDLSSAEFECYVEGAAGFFPADNAEVPNLIPDIYMANSSIAKFLAGQGTIPVLFKSSPEAMENYEKVVVPGFDLYPQFAPWCLAIPAGTVIDAVDQKRTGLESRGGRHVPTSVDAGFAMVNQCAIAVRKIERSENGRIYLSDTNNSTNDFVQLTNDAADGKHLVPRDYSAASIQPAN